MTYKDDFYQAINKNWIEKQELGDTKDHVDHFSIVEERVNRQIYDEVMKWSRSEQIPNDYQLNRFMTFYKQASDIETREKQGTAPLKSLIACYKSLTSFDDYVSKLVDFEKAGHPNLMPFQVTTDLYDRRQHIVWAGAPNLTFPTADFYDESNQQMKELIALWKACQQDLLLEVGFNQEEAQEIVDNVIKFDRLLSPYLVSQQDAIVEQYQIYEVEQFLQLVPSLPLDFFFGQLLNDLPSQIAVSETRFWEEFASKCYSEEMWPYLKSKLLCNLISLYSFCLTDRISDLATRFQRELSGIDQRKNSFDEAFDLTVFALGNDLSYWYSKTMFSSEDKTAVREMVSTIMMNYRLKIEKSPNWSVETKQKAIAKLEHLVIQIGGPEKYSTEDFKLPENGNLVETVGAILSYQNKMNWNKWQQSVNRNDWENTSFTVDAYYNPQSNKVTFPAGLLQSPFYSKDYSSVKNLARIGFLIAHEISHAFDNIGSQFDEFGSLNPWWSEKDAEQFDKFLKQVDENYVEGSFEGYVVDSGQTLSENIADIAGFSCIEAIVKTYYPQDLDEFYKEFAKSWRIAYKQEYLEMMLMTDDHLLPPLRVNNLLSNSKTFNTFYELSSEDGMRRSEEKQISFL